MFKEVIERDLKRLNKHKLIWIGKQVILYRRDGSRYEIKYCTQQSSIMLWKCFNYKEVGDYTLSNV